MQNDELKNKLIDYLSKQEKVIMAFLYGSYAKGTALKDSDLDIAVYFKEPYSSKDEDRIWDELQEISGKDVELLNLNRAKEPVAWQAIRGIPLVIKKRGLYIKYMLRISAEAMDFQQDLEEIWLIKRGLKYA